MTNQEKVLGLYRIQIYFLFVPFLFLYIFITSCSSLNEQMNHSPDQIYQEAMQQIKDKEYKRGAQLLEGIELNYPYWPQAAQATMQAAHFYFQANRFDECITAAQRYISLHPGLKDIEEAYYLVTQSYFNKIPVPGRDSETSEKALAIFEDFLRRYPKGKRADQARKQKLFIDEVLASEDMIIGRYYLSVNHYIPAMRRFGNVVKRYSQTSQVPEALARLVEIYVTLGVRQEAQKVASMLALNAPTSSWYAQTYELLKGRHMLDVKPVKKGKAPLPSKVNDFN